MFESYHPPQTTLQYLNTAVFGSFTQIQFSPNPKPLLSSLQSEGGLWLSDFPALNID